MTTGQVKAILEANGRSEEKIDIAINVLCEQFAIESIEKMYPITAGMTNYLFHFEYLGKRYLLRIPGENTEELLDRNQEAWVYRTLSGKNITDTCIYINPECGIKITEYIDEAQSCDKDNEEHVYACINHLRKFHQLRLGGGKEFDVFEQLVLYEKNCRHDLLSIIPDYHDTRQRVMALRELIGRSPKEKVLCHIDPVPDNFLLKDDKVYLIDWEYASLADPHIDIAMFCIYAGYDKERIDKVIQFYFDSDCSDEVKNKIYAYIAVCGLLWVVWCEIKRDADVVFEEYEKIQYNYAVEFSKYVTEEGLDT